MKRILGFAAFAVGAVVHAQPRSAPFTVAVIPDTQNYIDFHNQRAEGFPFDAKEIFFGQMAYVARNVQANGGAIAFVSAVGDVWQHSPGDVPDPASAAAGLRSVRARCWRRRHRPSSGTRSCASSCPRRPRAIA